MNLPAPVTFGDTSIPLADTPTAVLCFALGAAVSRPVDADQFAPFCAVVEELLTRPVVAQTRDDVVRGSAHATNAFDHLLTMLPGDLARRVAFLYQAQRGQRWARTGTPHGTTPTIVGKQLDSDGTAGV